VARPFLLNQVFDVNPQLAVSHMPLPQVPGLVIDNFLKHPDQARAVAGAAPAANWKHTDGGRNFVDYYDCRVRFPVLPPNPMIAFAQHAIKRAFGVDTWPQDPSLDVNWFMQIHARRADSAIPHHDAALEGHRAYTCIVYLNQAEECSGGTAFFRFRPSASLVPDPAYHRAVQQNTGVAETGRDYWLERAGEFWELLGSVDMAPGRMVIFPAEYFHAAYHPKDSFFDFPRLTMVFWMIQ
jgi:hypothetical protein